MVAVEKHSHERIVRMKLVTRGTALALVAGAISAGASTGLSAAEPQTTRDARKIAATSKSHVNSARNAARQTITDVSLEQGGVLRGVLVDEQGRPLVKSAVIIRQGRRVFSRTNTGLKGEFLFKGLRGGVYEIASVRGNGAFRVWAPGTAPKAARGQALIVSRSPSCAWPVCRSRTLDSDKPRRPWCVGWHGNHKRAGDGCGGCRNHRGSSRDRERSE